MTGSKIKRKLSWFQLFSSAPIAWWSINQTFLFHSRFPLPFSLRNNSCLYWGKYSCHQPVPCSFTDRPTLDDINECVEQHFNGDSLTVYHNHPWLFCCFLSPRVSLSWRKKKGNSSESCSRTPWQDTQATLGAFAEHSLRTGSSPGLSATPKLSNEWYEKYHRGRVVVVQTGSWCPCPWLVCWLQFVSYAICIFYTLCSISAFLMSPMSQSLIGL